MPMENKEVCKDVWGLYSICKGDKIRIYPRGARGMVAFIGIVDAISDFGILLKVSNKKLMLFRLSEVKFIEKVGE